MNYLYIKTYIYMYTWIFPGLKFEPLNHQKQTWGLKFDTQTEGLGIY